jgi:ferredoxin
VKVAIDQDRCAGHALCVDFCPTVFVSNPLGYAELVDDGVVPQGDEDDAGVAIASCPERAIDEVE